MNKYVIILACFFSSLQAQVGIGTITPDASAILDVNSNNKGILLPKVSLQSLTDVTTVLAPANGLMVYNTNVTSELNEGIYIYNTTTNNWNRIKTKETTVYNRLIRNHIGFSNVSITNINGYVNPSYGNYASLFNNLDDTGGATFHFVRNSGVTTDWGFAINLSPTTNDKYIIKEVIFDGRNDCCTERLNNVLVRLYNNGSLVYSSGVIQKASKSRNSITIPIDVYTDEIRIVVEKGGDTIGNLINFSELEIIATN